MMISLLGTFIGLFLGAGFAVLQAKFKLISIYSSTGAYLQAYPVKLIYTDFLLVFATVFIIAFIAIGLVQNKAAMQVTILGGQLQLIKFSQAIQES